MVVIQQYEHVKVLDVLFKITQTIKDTCVIQSCKVIIAEALMN